MSLKYVKDNLLNFTSWNCLAHSCNAQGVFGAGIAKQIKNEYPAAYEAYMEAYEKGDVKLGHLSMAILPSGKRIVNMVTQQDIGTEKRQVDYEALYCCLESLKFKLEEAAKQGKNYKLGLPYGLSAGLAGGNWIIIEAIIKALFENSPVEVYIVEYNKN